MWTAWGILEDSVTWFVWTSGDRPALYQPTKNRQHLRMLSKKVLSICQRKNPTVVFIGGHIVGQPPPEMEKFLRRSPELNFYYWSGYWARAILLSGYHVASERWHGFGILVPGKNKALSWLSRMENVVREACLIGLERIECPVQIVFTQCCPLTN